MLPFYTAELLDLQGRSQLTLELISVQAARAFNTAGSATLVIPDSYGREHFRMNTRMKLYRHDYFGVPYNFGETWWFLQKLDYARGDGTYTLSFVDALGLLKSRLVAYSSETLYADKTLDEFDVATYSDAFRLDNLMRQFVRENMGPDALDARRILSWVEVEGNRNQAPHGEKQAAWQDLLAVASDLASQSAAKGLPLVFDLAAREDGTFRFQVQQVLSGLDRRSGSRQPLLLSEESGMLSDIHEIDDWSNVATYCYALGYGSGAAQMVAEAWMPQLLRHDPFSRIEMTVNASDTSEPSVLLDTAKAALQGRRPKRQIAARVVENSALSYGRDIRYGDGVVVQVGGAQYDARIDAVTTRWEDGEETIEMRLSGEVFLGEEAALEGEAPQLGPLPTDPDAGGGENAAPVITLLGVSPLLWTEGVAFSDPGATASDAEDGDISSSIVVGGASVDVNTPGDYVITYDVTDSGGLSASQVTRTVSVVASGGIQLLQEWILEGNTTDVLLELDYALQEGDVLALMYGGHDPDNNGFVSYDMEGTPGSTQVDANGFGSAAGDLDGGGAIHRFGGSDANGVGTLTLKKFLTDPLCLTYVCHLRGVDGGSPGDYDGGFTSSLTSGGAAPQETVTVNSAAGTRRFAMWMAFAGSSGDATATTVVTPGGHTLLHNDGQVVIGRWGDTGFVEESEPATLEISVAASHGTAPVAVGGNLIVLNPAE